MTLKLWCMKSSRYLTQSRKIRKGLPESPYFFFPATARIPEHSALSLSYVPFESA
jgi:hypothetical protein